MMHDRALTGTDPTDIDPSVVPETEAELVACLASWRWRIFSGRLYKIITKDVEPDDDGSSGTLVPFKPNRAQRRFLMSMRNRNIILKARQLGFTTLIAIIWLDHALWNANQSVAIIAHTLKDAKKIFRQKVKLAYDNLPPDIRARVPTKIESAEEIVFAHNNSSIIVSTSVRSDTIHRLHISEMGKLGAKFPEKALEIITGSLPAVPESGIAIIESTSEGQSGEFYKLATKAQARNELNRPLTRADYLFYFVPWFANDKYRADPTNVVISPSEHEYFAKIEAETGIEIDAEQRAFYIQKRDMDFSGDVEKMWREYPSTPNECWQKSTEGTFFASQISLARVQGRITTVPHLPQVRVNTFWDIGSGDGTAVWFHQYVGVQHRFINFFEDWAKGYDHYIRFMRETGYVFGGNFLPHDAMQVRQMANTVASPLEMLQEIAPDLAWHIVPRVEVLQHGIELTRSKLPSAWFDEEKTKEGLIHLQNYRKKWNSRLGDWGSEPDKDNEDTEAADAIRQWAQGFDPALIQVQQRPRRRRQGGMTT